MGKPASSGKLVKCTVCTLTHNVCIVVSAISALVYIVVCVKVMELSALVHHRSRNRVEYPPKGEIFIPHCNTPPSLCYKRKGGSLVKGFPNFDPISCIGFHGFPFVWSPKQFTFPLGVPFWFARVLFIHLFVLLVSRKGSYGCLSLSCVLFLFCFFSLHLC